MKPDIKIGVLVGVVVVVVLLVFFVNKGPTTDENTLPLVSPEPDKGVVQPTDPPIVKHEDPVINRVIVEPPPMNTPVKQPEPKIDPVPPETIVVTPVDPVPLIPETREPRYYQVKSGDSLSEISEKYYGHEKFRVEIYRANRQLISNPDFLQIGWRLRIPYPEEISGLGQNE